MAGIFYKIFALTVDLTKENVRNRCMFASIILMLYILLVFIILALIPPEKVPPDQIEIISDLQNKYIIADYLQSYSPSPRIKIKSQQGEVQDSITTMTVADFISNGDPNLPNCDRVERENIAGTLEFLRLQEVCRPILLNNRLLSDSKGITTFGNFSFERGPVGRYGFTFIAEDDEGNEAASSQKIYVNFESNVSSINILNEYPEFDYSSFQVEPGKPIKPQPRLRILDNNGKPVPNKRVIALAWPEPHFRGFGMQYAVWATKFALLSGDVSELSNANGEAVFTSLTIVGMNQMAVYLHFICDNAVSSLWSLDRSPILESFSIPYFKMPLLINDTAVPSLALTFVGNYSTVVKEGDLFKQPIKVKVTNKGTGAPIPGYLVIAEIIGEDNEYYPQGYRQLDYGSRLKQLLQPIPGKYNPNHDNPLLNVSAFTPILTDTNGEVTFSDLMFSVQGPAGIYKLILSCNGYIKITDKIYVQTSVTTVQFINQPPQKISVETSSVNDKLIPVLRITNSKGEGVPGKMPILTLLDADTGTPLSEAQVSLFMNNTKANEEFESSDDQGMIKILMHYQYMLDIVQRIKLRFTVEGISVDSTTVLELENNVKDQQLCGIIIDVNDKNGKMQLNNGVPFDLQFLILNEAGNPLPQAKAILNLDYNPGQNNWPPQQLLPVLQSLSAVVQKKQAGGGTILIAVSDFNGLATFDKTIIQNGQNSFYTLSVSVYSEGQKLTQQQVSLIEQTGSHRLQQQVNFNQKRMLQDEEESFGGGDQENQDYSYSDEEANSYLDPDSEIDFSQMEEQLDSSYQDPEAYSEDPANYEDATEQLDNFDIQSSSSLFSSQASGSSSQVASKMCFMNPNFQIFLRSIVGNLYVDTVAYDNNLDQFNITIRFADIYDQIIVNYNTSNLKVLLTEFPFYFADQYMATSDKSLFYLKLFDLLTDNPITDSNGQVVYVIKLKTYMKGVLGIVFLCEGVFTLPEYLFTEFLATKVTIQQQPASNCGARRSREMKSEEEQNILKSLQSTTKQNQPTNYDQDSGSHRQKWQNRFFASISSKNSESIFRRRQLQSTTTSEDKTDYGWSVKTNDFVSSTNCNESTAFYVGNQIGQFKILVQDAANAPLADYTVIAILDANSQDSEANKVIIDLSDIYGNQNTVVLGNWRKAITDSSGVATFNDLTFIDSRGFHCARIYFAVGHQYIQLISSVVSNLYCFKTSAKIFIEVDSNKYSKIILPNKNFPQPLSITKRGPFSDIELNYKFYFMAGLLFSQEGTQIDNPLTSSSIALDNFICYSMIVPDLGNNQPLTVLTPDCAIKANTDKNSTNYAFKKLLWLMPGLQKFKLSFSTLLNFRVEEKKNKTSLLEAANIVMKLMKLWKDPAALQQAILNEINKKNIDMPTRLTDLLTQIQQVQQTLTNLRAIQSPSLADQKQIFDTVQQLVTLSSSIKQQLTDLLLSSRQSSETNTITSTFQTGEIQIIQQPPLNIYVKDIISMEVLIKNLGGVPLPRVPVKVALVQGKQAVQDLDKAEQDQDDADKTTEDMIQTAQSVAQTAQEENITSVESAKSKLNAKFEEFLSDMGQTKADLDSLSGLAKKTSNAVIDPSRKEFSTKISGKAIVTTQILEGSPGKTYHFQFESQKVLSIKTQAFLLKNHIVKVLFSTDAEPVKLLSDQEIKNTVMTGNEEFSYPDSTSFDGSNNVIIKTGSFLKPLRILKTFKLKLEYEAGFLPAPPYSKSISFKVYKYIDPAQVQKYIDKATKAGKNISTSDLASLSVSDSDKASSEGSGQILQNVFTMVLSAGNAYRMAQPTEVYAPSTYVTYTEDNNGNMQIEGLNIKLSYAGKYQISVIVDGIQSPLSFGVFVEKSLPKSVLELDYVQIFIDSGFIVLLYICICFSSVPQTKDRKLKRQKKSKKDHNQENNNIHSPAQVLPIPLAGNEHDEQLTDKQQPIQTEKASQQWLIDSNLIPASLQRPKKSKNSMQVFIAIALGIILLIIQIIDTIVYVNPTKNLIGWIFRLINSFIFLIAFIIQLKRSLQKNYFSQARDELFWEYTYQKLFQKPSNRWIKHYRKRFPNLSLEQITELFKKERYLLKEKRDAVGFGIVSSIMPFRQTQQKLCVDNIYFLPQRLIASIFISMFSIAFIFYKVMVMAINVKSSIIQTFLQTKAQFIQFVATANRKAASLGGLIKIDEPTFASVQNMISEAQKMLESFLDAMTAAIIVAAILSLILYLFSILKLTYNFRQRVLEMRRGIYRFDILKSLGNYQLGFQFLPFHVSNSMIAFITFFLVFAIALTFIFWPILWILIWENFGKILTIVVSAVVSSLSLIVAKQLIFDEGNKCLRNRKLFSFFQAYQLYLSILAGIFSTIVRFIKTAVIGVFTIYVVDEAAFAGWVMRLAFADAVTKTYLIVLQINYSYNNPIKESFNQILKDAAKEHQLYNDQKQDLKLYDKENAIENDQNADAKGEKSGAANDEKSILVVNNGQNTKKSESSNENNKKKLTKLMLRNRMWLYYFMFQNQNSDLIKYRKKMIEEQKNKEKQKEQEQKQTISNKDNQENKFNGQESKMNQNNKFSSQQDVEEDQEVNKLISDNNKK